jgi:hypothetical protein
MPLACRQPGGRTDCDAALRQDTGPALMKHAHESLELFGAVNRPETLQVVPADVKLVNRDRVYACLPCLRSRGRRILKVCPASAPVNALVL